MFNWTKYFIHGAEKCPSEKCPGYDGPGIFIFVGVWVYVLSALNGVLSVLSVLSGVAYNLRCDGDYLSCDSYSRRGDVIIYRMAGKPSYSTSKNFSDVKKGAYYYDAVSWAVQNGIANGYSNGPDAGKFGVGKNVLRKDIVTFLSRYDSKFQ